MCKSDSRTKGYLIGSVSVIVNLVLFGLKYWAGRRTGSIALIADAWHTLSDTLTSLVVIAGFWIASMPGDREHPFGHGRAESIGAVIIGTILALVGVEFIQESIRHLQNREGSAFNIAALVIFGSSIVIKEALAQISIRIGKANDSQSLIADGWHHRSDAIASGLVFAGMLFGNRIWWIDGVMGILVSVLILYAAWGIIRGASSTILGEKPPETLVRFIENYIDEPTHGIIGIHEVSYHRYGNHKELILHAVVPANLPISVSHRSISNLEKAISEQFDIVPTVRAEPDDCIDTREARFTGGE